MKHLPPRHPACLAALCGLLATVAAPAQTLPPAHSLNEMHAAAAVQMAQTDLERQIFISQGPESWLPGGGSFTQERLIKGAPYCAEAVHENVQWLSDGAGGAPNRIVQQRSALLCRDSEGRTRQELDRGGRKVVYLRDPVAGESWLLDPQRKTAQRLATTTLSATLTSHDAGAMREFAQRMREWASAMAESARSGLRPATPTPPSPPTLPPLPPLPPLTPVLTPPSPTGAPATPPAVPVPGAATPAGWPAVPAPVLITRTDEHPHHGRHPSAPNSTVRVLRLPAGAEGPTGEWALPSLPVQWRASHLAPRQGGASSPLAPREIDGLPANGERTTWLIPAGKVGNEKPIEIVREVWTSPELMLTLSSRDFDPRSGEVSYRLRAVKRGEPDAALMRVPADYNKPGRAAPRASGPTG